MVRYLKLLILWIFCILTSTATFQVIKSQNFGSSSSYLSSNSITFSADTIGSGDFYSSVSTSSEISHTKDQTLYKTGLCVSHDSHYKFSTSLADGNYILILRFAEIQYDSAYSRVFSMNFCGKSLFEYLDIYQLAGGKNIAVDFFYEFTVSNGIVNYDSSQYSISKNSGQLDFEIITAIDKGLINALQIIKGTCDETRICNNCYDPLCTTCDYNTGICKECIYNAVLNEKNYCACPSKADNGSIIAILSAPSKACSNCMVTLDGTGSIGSGGLTYKWIIDGLTKSTDAVYSYTVPDASSQTTNVTLIVTDWCGFQNISGIWTISITKDDVIVDIKEYDLSYDTGKYSSFSADYIIADSANATKYQWTVSPPVKGLTNPNQKEIFIQFPTSGTYDLNLAVTLSNGKSGYGTASINVMPEIPSIYVTGVNSTFNNFTTVAFNATLLYQNGTYSKNYDIFIDNHTLTNCGLAKFNEADNGNFIFKSSGEVKSYYTCYFYVNALIYSGSYASTLCFLNITSTPVPEVYVSYSKLFFDWSSPIRFMANIPDQTDLIFEWQQTDNNTKISTSLLTTPTNQSSYTIKEFILTPQKEYEFTIHVRNTKTNATADVSTRRWVNSPPKYGTFTVTPNQGIVLETPFNAIFQGFVDPENNLPISYQVFQVQSNGETVAITPKANSNNFNIKIGDGSGIIPLIGRVYDSLGTFRELPFNVTVSPSTKNADEQANTLLNNGANVDQTLYISSIVAISQYTFQNPSSGTSTESVVSTLLKALNNWSDSKVMTDIDVSTTFDVISVFLQKSESYSENLIQNISQSLDSALSKADTLDDNTYKVFIKQVDVVSGRSSQILNSGNSTNSAATYADLWQKIINSFSLSSEKYQKKTNPNEPPISITGSTFNVTLESRDFNTVKNTTSWNQDCDNCNVAFNINVTHDSGNIVYHVPIISTSTFGNVSQSLPTKFTQVLPMSDSCKMDGFKLVCPTANFTQDFTYDVSENSFYVQPNISKIDNGELKPATQLVNISSVSVSFPNLDSLDSDFNCFILDSETDVFGSSLCDTILDGYSVTCDCSFANLIAPFKSPNIGTVAKYLSPKFDPEIYNDMAWIPIVIFSALTFIYVILFRDMRKLDSLTGKFLKAKCRYIIKAIKLSIEGVVKSPDYNTIKKIKKDIEGIRNKIIHGLGIYRLYANADVDFLKFLLTKDRIIKHSEEALLKPKIIELKNENQEFQELVEKIKAPKPWYSKFRLKKDKNEVRLFELIQEKNRIIIENKLVKIIKLNKKTKKRIIKELKIELENENENENHNDIIVDVVPINFETDPDYKAFEVSGDDIYLAIDSGKSVFNYDINSYGYILKFLERNMKNNYKPEKSFIYYFLENSLVFGLISFTDLNFSRTARLTLLMVNLFLCCWITILFFGAQTYFYSEVSILGFSQVQLILYSLTLVINQAILFVGQFLPSNYLYKEFLKKKKYSNKLSKASFVLCWLLMIGMFIVSCINAQHLSYNQQVNLTQTIFISMLTTVLLIGVVKPALIAIHKTSGINNFIMENLLWCYAVLKRIFCCKVSWSATVRPMSNEEIINNISMQV